MSAFMVKIVNINDILKGCGFEKDIVQFSGAAQLAGIVLVVSASFCIILQANPFPKIQFHILSFEHRIEFNLLEDYRL